MEFDKSRCFTSLNADELKAGDKVIVACSLHSLKWAVEHRGDKDAVEIDRIADFTSSYRFRVKTGYMKAYPFAYLVEKAKEPPVKKYRPFNDFGELHKTWAERVAHDTQKRFFTPPCIWVREKGCKQSADLITCYGSKGITVRGKGMYFDTLFTMFEFLDGSPCGVEE